MDQALKAKWVEALRSGDYRQIQFNIGEGNELCCIGVGATVAGMPPDGGARFGTDVCAGTLGLSTDQKSALILMNDTENKSFSEIADYIEANL